MDTDVNRGNLTISKDYISQLFDFDQENASMQMCLAHRY